MKRTVKLELQEGVAPEDLAQACNAFDGEFCVWYKAMMKCPFKDKPCYAVGPEDWERVIEDEQD